MGIGADSLMSKSPSGGSADATRIVRIEEKLMSTYMRPSARQSDARVPRSS